MGGRRRDWGEFDAALQRVVLRLPAEALRQADELAELTGRTRAVVLRDCIAWGLAREHAWRERNIATELHREQLRADEAEALQRARERHPDRFDGPPGLERGRYPPSG